MVSGDGSLGSFSFLAYAAVFLATAAVVLLAPLVMDVLRRFAHHARVRNRLSERSRKDLRPLLFDDLSRNGIVILRPLARQLLKNKRIQLGCSRIKGALEQRLPDVSSQSVCELELLASIIVALLVFFFTRQAVLAVVGACIPPWVSIQRASVWHQANRSQLREQLPDALHGIGMCFNAGHTLQQALGHIAVETPDPLGRQLRHTAHDIDVGYGISEALRRLKERTECEDLHFVLVALDIHHMTGGSLKELLEGAATSISESFELARSFEVQTAQARMSARIVTVMPLVLVALLSIVMPGYLATFFGSFAGFMLLVGALGLEALGVFLIRRILGIELD